MMRIDRVALRNRVRPIAQWAAALSLLIMLSACQHTPLVTGTGEFLYADRYVPLRPLNVYYHLPEAYNEDSPIVFVMHGMNRNAAAYREPWIPLADAYGFVLVLPEFSKEFYPGSALYNLGNAAGPVGVPRPVARWDFSQIERLFDEVKRRTGNKTSRYYIYGHSAGGQFVHRMVLLLPSARIQHAVAANAGWYTMPTFDTGWPYGLRRAPATRDKLRKAFETRMTILLGDRDTNPEDPQLNQLPRAVAQGPHRFARGHTFYETAQQEAEALDTTLNWDLREVPGVGHSNGGMAPAAADAFFGPEVLR